MDLQPIKDALAARGTHAVKEDADPVVLKKRAYSLRADGYNTPTAHLYANAPTWLAALVAEVARLREELAQRDPNWLKLSTAVERDDYRRVYRETAERDAAVAQVASMASEKAAIAGQLGNALADKAALVAQVAVLVSAVQYAIDHMYGATGTVMPMLKEALANIPAAATALLAERDGLREQRDKAALMVADWLHGEDCPLRDHDWDDNNNPIGYEGQPLTVEDCDCGLCDLQAALAHSS